MVGRFFYGIIYWLGNETLAIKYKRIFLNSQQKKNVFIGDVGKWENERWCQGLSWRRAWFCWELPEVQKFLEEINGVVLNYEQDKLLWKNDQLRSRRLIISQTATKLLLIPFSISSYGGYMYLLMLCFLFGDYLWIGCQHWTTLERGIYVAILCFSMLILPISGGDCYSCFFHVQIFIISME